MRRYRTLVICAPWLKNFLAAGPRRAAADQDVEREAENPALIRRDHVFALSGPRR